MRIIQKGGPQAASSRLHSRDPLVSPFMLDGREFPQVRMPHVIRVGGEVGLDSNSDKINERTQCETSAHGLSWVVMLLSVLLPAQFCLWLGM